MPVLIHPTYFPNVVTAAVMVQEQVVWEAFDNFQKQTYRNRCHIATDQGKLMLNIPVQHVGGTQGRQLYKDVCIDYSMAWPKQHWKTLQTAYRTSPFFEFYEDDIAPLFEKKEKFLLDLNFKTIQFLCEALQVEPSGQKSTSYQDSPVNLIDRRNLVNAKTDIPVKQKPYFQVFGERHGFLENLSMLDLLFNKGPETLEYLNNINTDGIFA